MADAMRGATRVRNFTHPQLSSDLFRRHLGNGLNEPWPQSTSNPAHHDRVRKGEFHDGHEGRDDVGCC